MLKKFILLIVFLSLLSNCGFTPLHSNKLNEKFSIGIISYEGNKEINNYLKVNLKQFQNKNYVNKFELNINTTLKKNILAKDKTAKITNYKLTSTSIIQVNYNGELIKEIKVLQDKNINNYEDKYEERKNEKNIMQNFASKITREIITEISILNDN